MVKYYRIHGKMLIRNGKMATSANCCCQTGCSCDNIPHGFPPALTIACVAATGTAAGLVGQSRSCLNFTVDGWLFQSFSDVCDGVQQVRMRCNVLPCSGCVDIGCGPNQYSLYFELSEGITGTLYATGCANCNSPLDVTFTFTRLHTEPAFHCFSDAGDTITFRITAP